jgi:hypothetical protein
MVEGTIDKRSIGQTALAYDFIARQFVTLDTSFVSLSSTGIIPGRNLAVSLGYF